MANTIPLIVFILIALVSEVFSLRKVVLLSFDGFRADYYTEKRMPKLWKLRKYSAAPDYMNSIFPPKTMVTLHSVATGVYPNQHGVYANEMFDKSGQVKQYKDNHFDDLNDKILPIWVENEKKDDSRNSAVMMWPGGDFMYQRTPADFITKFDPNVSWKERAQQIVTWATSTCNLVMAYFEDTPCYDKDKIDAHIATHIAKVDETIENIYDGLVKAGLPGELDIIIMSDHGTSKVPGANVIKIESIVTDSSIVKIVSGPLVFLKIPNDTDRASLYTTLKSNTGGKFVPYIVDSFQDDWYINTLDDLKDVIVLVANPNYTFMEKSKFEKILKDEGLTEDKFVTLENGYDNDIKDMRALFVGIGPNFLDDTFPKNVIQLIDVYPVLKALLELKGNASDVQTNNSLSVEMKKLLEPKLVNEYENTSN